MKKILILFFLFAINFCAFAQNSYVFAEFYSDTTGKSMLTDMYTLTLYDNAKDDSANVVTSGFQLKLFYVCYNDSLRTAYHNAFPAGTEGIVRLKIWDTLLYGYGYIRQVDRTPDVVTVTLIGMKNVPQRKKLLFKDSPTLRMWRHPWVGEK